MYKFFNWFFVLVFVAFAALQYNDPDPLVWISVYGVAALICLVALTKRNHYGYHILFFLFTAIWAFVQWPPVFEGFGEDVITKNMELARESGGLIICAVVALVNGVVAYRIKGF